MRRHGRVVRSRGIGSRKSFVGPSSQRVITLFKLGLYPNDQDRHRYAGTDREDKKMGFRTLRDRPTVHISTMIKLDFDGFSVSFIRCLDDVMSRGHF